MQINGNISFEEHLYWIAAVVGLLTLAVFITFVNPAALG
jgi:hypothetical protein